ncbi:glycosyltransferase family 4 protein [Thiorhodococcus minor]|uniref:Glycosyltransferase family 4 protein n=1 Tax=Thiorhodococcus minor TaxID=57489 RepID=A0A6M0JUC8_9GAMM|nr:glycosyltransferase family 4 protein [Thiorhodococcus minor]
MYLVEERANPSSDFFVLPVVRSSGRPIVRCDFLDTPHAAELRNATVIFVRYVPRRWARLVASVRDSLSQLIFFMDDDLLDFAAARGMPLRYRLKLAHLATLRRRWLRDQGAMLWVSTPYLYEKYADWRPRLVQPVLSQPPGPDDLVQVFYHGSASHAAEIDWLYPVMAAALSAEPRLTFEIIGTKKINRRYRRLPRTTVVHPMSWPTYQAFIRTPSRQIGLAPLLDRPFNRARSCTKLLDITRAGAVGIFSPGPVCADVVEHGVNGWMAPLDSDAWVEAILLLTRDSELRRRLVDNAKACLAHLHGRSTIGM